MNQRTAQGASALDVQDPEPGVRGGNRLPVIARQALRAQVLEKPRRDGNGHAGAAFPGIRCGSPWRCLRGEGRIPDKGEDALDAGSAETVGGHLNDADVKTGEHKLPRPRREHDPLADRVDEIRNQGHLVKARRGDSVLGVVQGIRREVQAGDPPDSWME